MCCGGQQGKTEHAAAQPWLVQLPTGQPWCADCETDRPAVRLVCVIYVNGLARCTTAGTAVQHHGQHSTWVQYMYWPAFSTNCGPELAQFQPEPRLKL